MERIWLQHYPQGVPADVDLTAYASVVALLEDAFARFASRPSHECMGRRITYAEVDAGSRAIGGWLQSKGLTKGDRVAVMMPNVLQYPVIVAGILRAGLIVVNVNPLYTPRELEHQLKDAGASAIFILENFASVLQQVIAHTNVKHVVVARMGDMLGLAKGAVVNTLVRRVKKLVPAYALPGALSFKAVLAAGKGLQLQRPGIGPDDVAFLQYTGGTTGVAKGATLLHRNIVANILQTEAWVQPALAKGRPVEQVVMVTALPLYHIFSLTICMMLGARMGALGLLIPNPRDIAGLVRELARHRFNIFPAVNTLNNGLLNNAAFAKLDFSGLKVCIGGGMAVQKSVAERWRAVTGCPIIEGFGLSETSPVLSCVPVDNAEFTGTIGYPVSNTWMAILDDDGKEVPQGQAGEIAARGPQVMAGYWNRPDETAKVMTASGWFKTGDIGVMDEKGQFKIVDRKKDMVLVSGFNVFPNEIEEVVAGHPGVLECAVVGVPDAATGEAVMLFVVKRDPKLDRETLAAYCAQNLTNYKRPRHIVFRNALPKTNVGKILRRELRDEAVAAAAGGT